MTLLCLNERLCLLSKQRHLSFEVDLHVFTILLVLSGWNEMNTCYKDVKNVSESPMSDRRLRRKSAKARTAIERNGIELSEEATNVRNFCSEFKSISLDVRRFFVSTTPPA